MESLIAVHSYWVDFFVFAVGASCGSFFNVCIYRIPLEQSIVSPGSSCVACGRSIPWYHNIPVISWLFLRGRAACCGVRVDFRYWLIEVLTGILFLMIYLKYHQKPGVMLSYMIFTGMLIIASFIDVDHYIIPDRFTLGGCLIGFICSSFVPQLHQVNTAWAGFTESLRGAFVCGLILYIVAEVGTKLFKKEAMGMGDVKFIAAMGAFLGSESLSFILPVSALIGSIFGLFLVFGKQGTWGTRLAYGPFLALASIIWIFGGGEWTTQYWHQTMQILMSK